MRGNQLKGALAAAPKQIQPLQRLSPGVYRGANGQLVNQQGGALPNQPHPYPQPSQPTQAGMPPMHTLPQPLQPQGGQVPSWVSGEFSRQPLPYQQPMQNLIGAATGAANNMGQAYGNKPYYFPQGQQVPAVQIAPQQGMPQQAIQGAGMAMPAYRK